MNSRLFALSASCFWVLILGCSPSNTPEVPPPPPMANPLPVDPIAPPTVTPTPKIVDPTTSTPVPLDSTPPETSVSVGELIEKLHRDPDRTSAAEALATKGKEAVPALTKLLDHADWQVRAAAVFALGKIGSDANSAQERLKTIVEKDENEQVRVAAVFALEALAEETGEKK